MNCYNFSFLKSYTGFWEIDKEKGAKAPGTLNLHNHHIEIDFFYDEHNSLRMSYIPSIKGEAFATNEQGKEVLYKFMLVGLHYKTCTLFTQGINHYVFDVEQFYVYSEGYDLKEINSICLRTHHLDKWLTKDVRKGFNIKDMNPKNGHFEFEFYPHEEICLFHDKQTNFDVNIFFGWQQQISTINTGVKTKNFLNIEFGDKALDIIDAENEISKVVNLLYLLWNFSFQPEFIEFKTSKGNCIQKISDKYSYKFIESSPSISPYTDYEDFIGNDFGAIMSKWFELYSNHSNALDTYFDTISNDHTTPNMKIKNFISTIDALSEGTSGPLEPIRDDSRNAKFLKTLESKLDRNEMKKLRDLVLKEKPTFLKPRFRQLVSELKDLLPEKIDNEFVNKIVNTRNNITHPKEKEENSFTPNQYRDAAYLLTKVIRAYLLKHIGIEEQIIKKIIEF